MSRLLTLAVVMLLGAAPRAHHSITAIYDRDKPRTLEGVVSEFRFVNPHPFLIVSVGGEEWKLELDNRYELVNLGMRGDTFKPGQRVTARGSSARDGSRGLYAYRIDRPSDGFWYEQEGSRPRMGRGSVAAPD